MEGTTATVMTWGNSNRKNSGQNGDPNMLVEVICGFTNSTALHKKKCQPEEREDEGRMNDGEIDKGMEWERKRALDDWAKEELEEGERRGQLLEQWQQKGQECALCRSQ